MVTHSNFQSYSIWVQMPEYWRGSVSPDSGSLFPSPRANNELADPADYFSVVDDVLTPQNFLQGIELIWFVFGAWLETRKSITPTGEKRYRLKKETLHLAVKKEHRVITQSLSTSLLDRSVRDTVCPVVWSNRRVSKGHQIYVVLWHLIWCV